MSRKDLFLDVSEIGCYEHFMQQVDITIKNLRLHRRDVGYVKHIFEGYEGHATITTVDKSASVIRLFIMPGFVSDVAGILKALQEEIDISEIDGGEEI